MRRVALTGALAALLALAPAGVAIAATSTVTVKDFEFSPDSVSIEQGDTVNWRFPGPDFNHSVTSEPPGQAESFDSDLGKDFLINHPGGNYVFPHVFTKLGSFTYYCKVHPFMTGTVGVRARGAPGGTSPADTRAPRVRLGGRRRQDIDRLAVRVRLNEAGTVTVTGDVKVRGRRRAFRLRRVRRTVAGDTSSRFRLRLRRASLRRVKRSMRRGRRATARVRITSVDRAGNRRITRKRIRLRR